MRILIVIGLTIAGLLLGYLFWQISEEGYARTWTRLPDPPGETIELLSAQDPAPYVRASDGSIYRYEERQERDWMEGTVPEGPTSGPIEVQRPCDLSAPEFSILSRPPRDVVDCVQGTVLYVSPKQKCPLSPKLKCPLRKGQEMDQLLEMSPKELSRLEVLQRLSEKRMNQKEASQILGLSTRQIKRLLRAYRQQGAAGLVSKHRGRKANNRLAEEVKRKALNLLKTKYQGFGPTLAHEKLVEKDKLQLSDESVRKLMIEEGLWKPRKVKKTTVHQLRERRACFGELVQIDGSPHDWFEGRAPACVLLVFIDDATGKLVQLLFVESESFFSYAQAAEGYFRQYGKPVAFYSDKNSIFRVNIPSAGAHTDLTQFGRAMQELDIQIICANTPQAKGRVERAIQTLQDRLPKELRLRRISSLTQANAYLPEFIQDFNHRFAEPPRSSVDLHRPLTPKEDLARIFAWQEPRTLSKNLTLQFHKTVYQIQTERSTYALRNAQVLVCLTAQDEMTILYNGKALPYTVYNRQAHQAEIVSTKQLDRVFPPKHLPEKPAPDHPWRKGFETPLSRRRSVTPSPKRDTSTLENR